MIDAADLTARLIRCPSVTPNEAGALVLLGDLLAEAGFEVHRVDRNGTPNLFARWGRKGARALGFNGLVNRSVTSADSVALALERARLLGYKGVTVPPQEQPPHREVQRDRADQGPGAPGER